MVITILKNFFTSSNLGLPWGLVSALDCVPQELWLLMNVTIKTARFLEL